MLAEKECTVAEKSGKKRAASHKQHQASSPHHHHHHQVPLRDSAPKNAAVA